jgi:hypothetical protein
MKATDRDYTVKASIGEWSGQDAALDSSARQSSLSQAMSHHLDRASGNIKAGVPRAALGNFLRQRSIAQTDFQNLLS